MFGKGRNTQMALLKFWSKIRLFCCFSAFFVLADFGCAVWVHIPTKSPFFQNFQGNCLEGPHQKYQYTVKFRV